MAKIVPVLKVRHMVRALAFYTEVLGATQDWRWTHEEGREDPSHTAITLFGQTVHLSSFAGDSAFGIELYIYEAGDIDELHAHVAAKAPQAVDWPPTLQPWGMYEVCLRDPDNNMLRFGTDEPPAPKN